MATREEIYVALWNLFLNHPLVQGKFVTTSRYLEHFDDVAPERMPALYITQTGESWERAGRGISFKRTLHSHLVLYDFSNAPGSGSPLQATLLNDMMEVISEVMTVVGTPDNAQTLGGLVYQAYVEGDVQIAEGLLQGKSVLVVPINIIMP